MVFSLWCVSTYANKRETISTSADSVTATEYEGANYFNPYTPKYSGVAYVSASSLHSVTIDNTRTGTYQSANFELVGFQEGDTLGFYASWSNNGSNIGAMRVQYVEPSGLAVGSAVGSTSISNSYIYGIVPAKPSNTAKLCLLLYYNYNSSDYSNRKPITYENIMVARNGQYKYIPNLEALAKTEYNKGLESANLGYFHGAEFHITPHGNGVYPTEILTPTAIMSGVSFNYIYNYLASAYTISNIDYVDIKIVFSTPVWGYDLKMVAVGNASAFVDIFSMCTEDGTVYKAKFEYVSEQNAYALFINSDGERDFYVARLDGIRISTVTDLQNLVLLDNGSEYRAGYVLGLEEGSTVSETQKHESYVNGYSAGEQAGYKRGYE